MDVDAAPDSSCPTGCHQRQVEAVRTGGTGELDVIHLLGPHALQPKVGVGLTSQAQARPTHVDFRSPGRIDDVIMNRPAGFFQLGALSLGDANDDEDGLVLEVDGNAGVTFLNQAEFDDRAAGRIAYDRSDAFFHSNALHAEEGFPRAIVVRIYN